MSLLKKSASILSLVALLIAQTTFADGGYHLLKKIPLGGREKWDYLTFDSVNQKLYLSHQGEVDVLSPSGKPLGTIPDTSSVHGIVAVTDAGIGFTSNGKGDSSTMFDLKTLKVLGQVVTGGKPDAIGYDPSTRCVYVCNGDDLTASVIDVSKGKVVATVSLGGEPEYLAADGLGHVFINLTDKSAVAVIDAQTHKVVKTVPLPPASTPCSMAIDKINGKLFIGCRNKTMVVLDTRSGQVVQTLPIGDHVDATVFDETAGIIFNSCGDGTITAIHQDTPSTYTVSQTIKTLPGAKTMTIDPDTHNLYLPAMDGGTFSLLILGQ